MNLLDDLNIETSGLQSNWHGLIRNSFVYLSGGTMRLAGDDLILELFREIFFEKRSEGSYDRPVDPEIMEGGGFLLSEHERYSLYMSKGRKKQGAQQRKESNFYTPLYPSLARYSWFRKQSERVTRDFFLRPLAQHIHGIRSADSQNISDFYLGDSTTKQDPAVIERVSKQFTNALSQMEQTKLSPNNKDLNDAL